MNQSPHKLEFLSWIAGIAGTALAFYLCFKPSAEVPPQPKAQISTIGPSFDCLKASSKVEKMICASPEVSILDLAMAKAYRELLAEKAESKKREIKVLQRNWLINVRDHCLDITCLKIVYEQRIISLGEARY
jgi:uncharacterized protein